MPDKLDTHFVVFTVFKLCFCSKDPVCFKGAFQSLFPIVIAPKRAERQGLGVSQTC